jgi:hypothetical protein
VPETSYALDLLPKLKSGSDTTAMNRLLCFLLHIPSYSIPLIPARLMVKSPELGKTLSYRLVTKALD